MSDLKLFSSSKIISLVGQTATGKTELALKLATQDSIKTHYSGVDLLSVDSKQVYNELKITSGSDIGDNFSVATDKKYPYFVHDQIRFFGSNIISVTQNWSAFDLKKLFNEIYDDIKNQNHLLILVGGTGFYHDFLFRSDTTANGDLSFRQELEKLTLKELQDQLGDLDQKRLKMMNNSDLHNKRRLSRAIEIALYQGKVGPINQSKLIIHSDVYFLLRKSDQAVIYIRDRVKKRLENGAIDEVEKIRNIKYVSPSAISTIGVNEISQYLDKKISLPQLIDLWTLHELQYSKRQLTWWKHKSDLHWLDVDSDQDLLLYFHHV